MKTYPLQLSVLILGFLTTPAIATVRYVNANSSTPFAPYLSPANAAVRIQDAVDVSVPGDQIMVADGIYQTGGRVKYGTVTNRVVLDKAVTVQSINGPATTIIQGFQVPGTTNGDAAVRCAYLTDGAALLGFTLSNGATAALGDQMTNQSGGGVWCESASVIVSNCVLTGCSSDAFGGGAVAGTLNNCTITGNRADGQGGGTYRSVLNNCTLTGNRSSFQGGGAGNSMLNNCLVSSNSANFGGGLYVSTANNCVISGNSAANSGGGSQISDLDNCTVIGNSATTSGGGVYQGNFNNCIVWFNSAPGANPNVAGSVTANHCCITPALGGTGNFTNSPQFVSLATGNVRPSSTSPCINSGDNAFAPPGPDLAGNPRISGGTVDVGAYEFQNPASKISYAWLLQYGLPITGAADFVDTDSDGMNNWQEWIAGTVPIDASSVLKMGKPAKNSSSAVITWQSVDGKLYYLQRSSNLAAPQPFSALQSNIVGQAGSTSYTDNSATGPGPFLYRVGVQ
jgi:parallel beta-helix repeat protein